MENWVSVFETDLIYSADLIKEILGEHNIGAVVLNRKDSSYPMLGSIQVMVCLDEKEEAEKIIKSIDSEQL